METWKAMEDLVHAGLVKSIGVSNFNSVQLERVITLGQIKPVVNQIECCPTLNQRKMIEFCRARDVVVIAYCPLRHPSHVKGIPSFLADEKVHQIATKYGKTAAQVILRYLLNLGTVPIPKSICEERMRSNIDVFDFELTEDEIKVIDSFNTGERLVNSLDRKHSKYWPFSTEF